MAETLTREQLLAERAELLTQKFRLRQIGVGDALTEAQENRLECVRALLDFDEAWRLVEKLRADVNTLLEQRSDLRAALAWQPIHTAPTGRRICLGWNDHPMLTHFELGYFNTVKGWVNTYGHPFNADPTCWFEPPAFNRETFDSSASAAETGPVLEKAQIAPTAPVDSETGSERAP
jgi:hypothetical protein